MVSYAHNWRDIATDLPEGHPVLWVKLGMLPEEDLGICSYCRKGKPDYWGTVHIGGVGAWTKLICKKC